MTGTRIRWVGMLLSGVGAYLATGCQTLAARPRPNVDIAAAARPILTLDPHAVWSGAYNRLVELGPESLAYLMEQPAMTQPAAPDDLNVLLHTSLVRLLANPASNPPSLSAACFETTLAVLHFDLKVKGRRLGTVVLAGEVPPRAWHELYPADFDHAAAAQVDLEADRRAQREWWLANQDRLEMLITRRRLEPQTVHLWGVLSRRCADRWEYLPEPRAVLCATRSTGPALLDVRTYDYNLVRAACIYLGSSAAPVVQRDLIELVGSPLPTVAHNARFALGYSPVTRLRSVLERFAEHR